MVSTGTTGTYTAALTGLTQGTEYSYRAYTISSQGTTYTSVATFTTLSNNADLSALTLSSGTLSPTFASGTTAYTASVPNPTTSITVTPTRAQANATIEARVNAGAYAPVTSGSASAALLLNVGSNTVDVRVTAEDGNTQKTYSLTITRRATQTITFANPGTQRANATVNLSATGGGSSNPISFTVTSGPATITNGVLSFAGSGEVTITASQIGNADYEPAPDVSYTFTVRPAQLWPPAPGDLILGVQATGGAGTTTNVFYNLGPAHTLRDSPNPVGTLVNLDAELTAAYGAGWSARTDLYFGVFANRSNATPSGIGSAAPENGDPAATVYTSKGVTVAGTGTPWTGFSVSALGLAATAHQGQIAAIDNIAANSNDVMTLAQSSNPVEWSNSWTQWNPTPGAAFSIFSGGIQAKISATAAHVDVFRIISTTGSGSYVTTVSLAANGDVTAARAGAATSYYTVTTNATNGSVSGGGAGILYASGTTAKLTAAPASGYGFDKWIGAPLGSPNPLTLVVDGNKTITANFGLFPAISAPAASGMTVTSVVLGATVTTLGNGRGLERGIIFSDETVNANPLLNGIGVAKVTKSGSLGVFNIPVFGLFGGTTYAFRGFVTTSIGTSYTDVAYATTDTAGLGTLSNRVIRGGESQLFVFDLAQSSAAVFTGTGASPAMQWELRNAQNGFVASGTGNVDFSGGLALGGYRLRITNPGAATETFSLNLDASTPASPRPDVSVGLDPTASSGVDLYNPPAPQQSVLAISTKAAIKNVFFRIDNDGPVPDAMRINGPGPDSRFRVSYVLAGRNVTAGVIAGTATTSVLAASDWPVPLFVRISPNRKNTDIVGKVVVNQRPTWIYGRETFGPNGLTVRATTDPTLSDTAIFQLNTVP